MSAERGTFNKNGAGQSGSRAEMIPERGTFEKNKGHPESDPDRDPEKNSGKTKNPNTRSAVILPQPQ